ncbi:hypothetical protein, partial [Listeria monocytogenes]
MSKFNLNNRILMFAICSSIEYDLRKYLINNSENIEIPQALYEKAINRNKEIKSLNNTSNE